MLRLQRRTVLIILAVWSVVCFLPLPAAGTGYTENPLTHLKVSRIYAAPRRDSLPIGLMEEGQPLQAQARLGDFLRIDCRGLTAYIHIEQVAQSGSAGYYVNCSLGSPDTLPVSALKPLELEQLRCRILTRAYAQLGEPYVYGGQEPGGFDCSGLMEYVFHYSGFSIPRTADAQLAQGLAIDKADLVPGDLVFFNNPEESSEFITHVGLSIGGGTFLLASVSNGVCIRSLETGYFAEHFVCARRLLNPSPWSIPSYDYFSLN